MRYAIGVFSFPYPFLGLRLQQTLVDGSFASPGRLGQVGMAQERPRPLSMDVVVQAIVSHSPDDLEKLKAAGLAANFCNFFGTKFLQIFGGLVLGCIRTKILQENMRLTAFFKLYKMCTLLHRSKLNILAKNQFGNQQFPSKFNI